MIANMRMDLATAAPTHEVAVLGLPGVNAFDFATAVQVFGRAAQTDGYRVTECTRHPGVIPTSVGYGIDIRHGLEAMASAQTVVVPGHDRREIPVAALEAVRRAHRRGARIASICTGAFLLAAAGLLRGRRATTHWASADELQAQHPDVDVVPDELYVDEGDVLTSGGVSAGIDLCLYLVELDLGHGAAISAARSMVAPLHRHGGQRQYSPPDRVTDDAGHPQLRPAVDWARANLHRPITIADMAAQVHQSSRTFIRTFTARIGLPPKTWLIQQRIARAQLLLEGDRLSIDAVAARAGFGTASNLRAHFLRSHRMSPSAYRAAFLQTSSTAFS